MESIRYVKDAFLRDILQHKPYKPLVVAWGICVVHHIKNTQGPNSSDFAWGIAYLAYKAIEKLAKETGTRLSPEKVYCLVGNECYGEPAFYRNIARNVVFICIAFKATDLLRPLVFSCSPLQQPMMRIAMVAAVLQFVRLKPEVTFLAL